MSASFMAPIDLVGIKLLETSFRVDPAGPLGDTVTEIKLDHTFDGLQTDEESGVRFGVVSLSTTVEMVDEGDEDRVLMHGSATFQGFLVIGTVDESDDDKLSEWVLSNGVSMLYAHARSHFMTLAKQSPMGDFVLPPIYVQEYLESKAAENEEESEKE